MSFSSLIMVHIAICQNELLPFVHEKNVNFHGVQSLNRVNLKGSLPNLVTVLSTKTSLSSFKMVSIAIFLHQLLLLGSTVVKCLTRDREAAGSSLTVVTVLCP